MPFCIFSPLYKSIKFDVKIVVTLWKYKRLIVSKIYNYVIDPQKVPAGTMVGTLDKKDSHRKGCESLQVTNTELGFTNYCKKKHF